MTGCDSAEDAALRDGNEAFATADYDAALTAYREAQEAAPDAAPPFYNAGNAHYRQEAYDLAELRGLQALKNNEGVEDGLTEDIYFNLGNSYFNLGQFDKAVTAYEEVLWRNPQALDAQHNLELALRMQEQQEEQSEEESSEEEQESGDEEETQEQESSDENQDGDSEQDEQESSGEDSSDGEEQSEQAEQPPQPDSGDGEEQSPSDDGSESSQPTPGDDEDDSPPTQTQAPAMQPLTSEQAAQLLESAAQNNESLQQYLQSQQNQTTIPGARDW